MADDQKEDQKEVKEEAEKGEMLVLRSVLSNQKGVKR